MLESSSSLDALQASASVVGVLVTVAAVVAALAIAAKDRKAAREAEERRYIVSILLQIQDLIAGKSHGANEFDTWELIRGLLAALPDPTPLRAVRMTYAEDDYKDTFLVDMKALHREYPNIKGAEMRSTRHCLKEVSNLIRATMAPHG